MSANFVYKILSPSHWAEADAQGEIAPSAVDSRDGFIHLSGQAQIAETLRLHYAHEPAVVLVECDAGALGEALRWEASRGGALFPHLYGALPLTAVTRRWRLHRDGTGAFELPNLGA